MIVKLTWNSQRNGSGWGSLFFFASLPFVFVFVLLVVKVCGLLPGNRTIFRNFVGY